MSIQNRFKFLILFLVSLTTCKLKAQFIITYSGETTFYLDQNCNAIFDLDGVFPAVSSSVGANITVDTLDEVLTGYELNELILGEDDFEVYFRFEDDQNNDSIFVFQIFFEDNTAPELSLDFDSIFISCKSELGPTEFFVDDNCDVVSGVTIEENLSQELPEFNCGPASIVVTNTVLAEDNYGNTATATQVIILQPDEIAPTAIVPSDTTINCLDDLSILLSNGLIDAYDNCDGDLLSIDSSFVIENGSCINDFVYKRYWTLTDSCGNVTIDSQRITVLDEIAPNFTVPSDITIACGDDLLPEFTGQPYDLSDNCSGIFDISYQDYVDTLSCPGDQTYTRIWTVMDSCLNTAIDTQFIHIIDTLAPVFTPPVFDSVYISCDQLHNLNTIIGPTDIIDACTSVDVDTSSVIINETCPNTYEIVQTYTIQDECLNVVSTELRIFVFDTIAPEIDVEGSDLSIACAPMQELDSIFLEWIANHAGAVSSDACNEDAELEWNVYNSGTNIDASLNDLNCNFGSEILLNQQFDFVVSDECENTYTFTKSFEVIDSEDPEIIFCGDPLTVNASPGLCGITLDITAPIAKDNCKSLDTLITVSKLEYLDSVGLPTTIINGVDFEIAVPTSNTVPTGDVILEIVLENLDINGQEEYMNVYGEDGSHLGQTTLAINQCGGSITQLIISQTQFEQWSIDGVVEISLDPNTDNLGGNLTLGINPTCPGHGTATVNLSYEASVSEGLNYFYSLNGINYTSLDITGSASDFFEVGSNVLSLKVTDCGGNEALCSRTIEVIDNEVPLLTCPSSVDVFLTPDSCQILADLQLPDMITDNCSPGSANQINLSEQFIPFFYNADLEVYVADTVFLSFSGISSSNIGSVDLNINIQGDVEQIGDFFFVYTSDGTLIGNTELGGVNVIPGNCSEPSQVSFTITEGLFNSNVLNGNLELILVPNLNSINPCAQIVIDNINGVQVDSVSSISASLIYSTWNLEYYVNNSNPDGNTVIESIDSTYSEIFGLGEYEIFFIGSDSYDNLDTCSYIINVIDSISPSMSCFDSPSIDFNSLELNPVELDINLFDNQSSDNCQLDTLYLSQSEITCSDASNGSVLITLFGEDAQGNTSSCTSNLIINDVEIIPSYAGICNGDTLLNELNLCLDDSLFLFSNISVSDISVLDFAWKNPDGVLIASTQDAVIPINAGANYSGVYTLEISGNSVPDVCSRIGTISVSTTTIPAPVIQFSVPDTICEGTNIDLTIPNYSSAQDLQFHWYKENGSGNDQLIGTTNDPSLNLGTELEHGEHCFYVEAEKDCCSASSTSTYCIEILKRPVIVLSDTFLQVCQTEELIIDVTQANSPNLNYVWTGNDLMNAPIFGEPLMVNNFGLSTGLKSINIEAYHASLPTCSVSEEVIVEVLSKPDQPVLDVDFQQVCEGADITFEVSGDTVGINSYTYTIGNSSYDWASSVFPIVDIESSQEGPCTVVTNRNGCSSEPSNIINLEVISTPQAEIASETEICSSETEYELNANGPSNLSYIWTLPDGSSINAQFVIIENPEAGTYTLFVDNNLPACSDSDTLELVIFDNPQVLAINDSLPDCYSDSGFELILSYESNTNQSLSQQWYFNEALIGVDTLLMIDNPSSANSGMYSVVLIDELTTCESEIFSTNVSIPTQVEIPAEPIAIGESDNIFCEHQEVIFQTEPIIGASTYTWYLNSEVIATTLDAQLEISDISDYDSGILQVQVETGSGCTSDLSLGTFYEILVLPEIVIDHETKVCAKDSFDISVQGAIFLDGTVTWQIPSMDLPIEAFQINDAQNESGLFTYYYLYEESGCQSELDSIEIIVKPLPLPTKITSPLDVICLDEDKLITLDIDPFESGVDYAIIMDGEYIVELDGNPGPVQWQQLITPSSGMSEYELTFELEAFLDGCLSDDNEEFILTVYEEPDILASVISDTFRYCNSGSEFLLEANQVINGDGISGTWTAINSIDPILTNPNNHITSVVKSSVESKFYYDFAWSLSYGYGACTDYSKDTTTLYIAVEDQAYAGLDIDTCNVDAVLLTANPSSNIPLLGFWDQPDVQASIINTAGNAFTTVNFSLSPETEYKFYWNLPDYGCGSSIDTLEVRLLNEFPMLEEYYVEFCGDGSFQLNAIESDNYEGVWSSPDLEIIFQDVNQHNSLVSNLIEGPNTFYYDFLNGVCGEDGRQELIVDYTYSPKANDDILSIEYAGTNILIDVLLNDFNSDFELDQIDTLQGGGPVHGSYKLEGNNFRYFSNPNYVGVDSFKYKLISEKCGTTSIATVYVNIGENDNCDLIPNIITPNNDGYNDEFIIPCLFNYPNHRVQIFNIWGDKVLDEVEYDNTWDGGSLPTGTYYYVVKLSPSQEEIIGFLHIQK
jgi:gliding motility-associated-like protein